MVGSLFTGISGLAGQQTALDNESNNIANVNTIGYKASRVSFADQIYQDKIGKGVTVFDVEKTYTQGNIRVTGVSFDLALSGDGFFQVADGNDTYYTRAGNFRMGQSGTLEDVGANTVQGWAIAEVTPEDVDNTDPNTTFFTDEYSKILGNTIINDTNTVETIATKATDYDSTAATDDPSVFNGANFKSASTKRADVEDLISQYNAALSVYSEADPKPTEAPSRIQSDLLNFPFPSGNELSEGDEVFAFIDGVRYTASFDTDNATTMKNFADEISDSTGFRAYVTDNATSPFDVNTQVDTEFGYLVVEGIKPGISHNISEFGWTDGQTNNTSRGETITIQQAVLGSGLGHIESIEDALRSAVAGKQVDVYDDLAFAAGENYSYQINIYDKVSDSNIEVPADPGFTTTAAPADLDEYVAALNADPDLSEYIKAYNFNGNLVINTTDNFSTAEFSGTMTGPVSDPTEEVQSLTLSGTAASAAGITTVTLNGSIYNINVASGDTLAEQSQAIVDAIDGLDSDISNIEVNGAGVIVVTYADGAGEIAAPVISSTVTGSAFASATTTPYDGSTIISGADVLRDADLSGSEGAGAEFLKIVTTINQTASRGDIQLRLDTLGITDSAFGDFSVDSTGLITMRQDGVDFAIGQVAIARFTDNRGLEAIGDNLLQSTTRSGTAIFNTNNDKTAEITGGSLELSTADLSESLVNLVVFQRAFEANAKSITTADGILTTLINLKQR